MTLVKGKKREVFLVKYECLPDWCAVCGLLGHVFKECGDGVHLPSALVFKDLRAFWFKGPGRGPGGGRGCGMGHGGKGAGRGSPSCPEDGNGDFTGEFEDPESTMLDADKNRKRMAAALNALTVVAWGGGGLVLHHLWC